MSLIKCDITNENGCMRISVSGEIDHHTAKELRAEADKEIKKQMPEKLIIDMGGVTFMDSSGLGLVLGRQKICDSIGAYMTVINAPERIKTMFDMSGLDRIINYKGESKKQ